MSVEGSKDLTLANPTGEETRFLGSSRGREIGNSEIFEKNSSKLHHLFIWPNAYSKNISDIRHNHKTNWAQILITATLECTVKIPTLRFRRSRNFVPREWPDFRNFLMKENSLIKSCLERKKLKFLWSTYDLTVYTVQDHEIVPCSGPISIKAIFYSSGQMHKSRIGRDMGWDKSHPQESCEGKVG